MTALATLLDQELAYDPVTVQDFSDHLPMALVALHHLGASDARLAEFADGYSRRLLPTRPGQWRCGCATSGDRAGRHRRDRARVPAGRVGGHRQRRVPLRDPPRLRDRGRAPRSGRGCARVLGRRERATHSPSRRRSRRPTRSRCSARWPPIPCSEGDRSGGGASAARWRASRPRPSSRPPRVCRSPPTRSIASPPRHARCTRSPATSPRCTRSPAPTRRGRAAVPRCTHALASRCASSSRPWPRPTSPSARPRSPPSIRRPHLPGPCSSTRRWRATTSTS